MKRIIAALIACTMITGAFVSCGSSDSSSKNADTPASQAKADYAGRWEWDDSSFLNITESGTIRMEATLPVTSMMKFNNDGTGTLENHEIEPGMFDFDGETYRLHVDNDDNMTLKRLEPNDGTEFFGKYELVSGVVYDSMEKGYNKRAAQSGSDEKLDTDALSILVDIAENNTDINILYTIGEISSDNTLRIEIGGQTLNGTYSVDGDVMTITNDKGDNKELKRLK